MPHHEIDELHLVDELLQTTASPGTCWFSRVTSYFTRDVIVHHLKQQDYHQLCHWDVNYHHQQDVRHLNDQNFPQPIPPGLSLPTVSVLSPSHQSTIPVKLESELWHLVILKYLPGIIWFIFFLFRGRVKELSWSVGKVFQLCIF